MQAAAGRGGSTSTSSSKSSISITPFDANTFGPIIAKAFGETEIFRTTRKTAADKRRHGGHLPNDDNDVDSDERCDFSTWLPDEVLVVMFCYLNARDLCKLGMVSTAFHECTSDNFLWKAQCHQRWPQIDYGHSEKEKGWWKKNYQTRMQQELMWMQKNFSGGDVWCIAKGWKGVGTIDQLQYDDEKVVVARNNHNENQAALEIWKLERPEINNSNYYAQPKPPEPLDIFSFQSTFNALQYTGALCLTASQMGTLDVWDFSAGILCGSLSVDGESGKAGFKANCLQFDAHGHVLVGYSDKKLRLWDLRAGKIEQTYDHNSEVSSVKFNRFAFCSGTRGGSLYLWDLRRNENVAKVLGAHAQPITGVACNQNSWISSADVSHQWDLELEDRIDLHAHAARSPECMNDLFIYVREGKQLRIDSLLNRPADYRHSSRNMFLDSTPRYPWTIKALAVGGATCVKFDFGRIVHSENIADYSTGALHGAVKIWEFTRVRTSS